MTIRLPLDRGVNPVMVTTVVQMVALPLLREGAGTEVAEAGTEEAEAGMAEATAAEVEVHIQALDLPLAATAVILAIPGVTETREEEVEVQDLHQAEMGQPTIGS
jgi:hypothetical protein